MPNQNNTWAQKKLAAGYAGAAIGYLFPINGSNISPDRCLMFAGVAGWAGAKNATDNNLVTPCTVNGISAALIFKLMGWAIPSLDGTVALFLLSGVAPSLIEASAYEAVRFGTSIYSWWNRPRAPDYQAVVNEAPPAYNNL